MSKPKIWQSIIRYVLVIIVVGLFTLPTYWMVTMAFKPKAEWSSAAGTIYWVPKNPTLENFDTVVFMKIKYHKRFEKFGSHVLWQPALMHLQFRPYYDYRSTRIVNPLS